MDKTMEQQAKAAGFSADEIKGMDKLDEQLETADADYEAKLQAARDAQTGVEAAGATGTSGDAEGATGATGTEGEAEGATGATASAEGVTGATAEASDKDDGDAHQERGPRTFAPQYQAQADVEAITKRMGEIDAERMANNKKMFEGELDAEAHAAADSKLMQERDGLLSKKIQADLSADFNRQQDQQFIERELSSFMKRAAKAENIGYGTNKYMRQAFKDEFLRLATSDEFKNVPMDELDTVFDAAHKSVKEMFGIKAAAGATGPTGPTGSTGAAAGATGATGTSAATKAAAGATGAAKPVPKTLAGAPNAHREQQSDNAELLTKFNALKGEDQERWLASQPKAVVDRLLNETLQ